MSNFVYTIAKDRLMRGSLDLLGQPVYLSALTSNASKDDSTGELILQSLAGNPIELVNKSIQDGSFSADPVVVEDIKRNQVVSAFLIYSDTTPLAYLGGSNFPLTGNGGVVTLSWKQQENVIFKL